MRNVTSDFPPTLLVHGDKDIDVPYEQSVTMTKELKRAGVAHEFITMDGGGHGLGKGLEDPVVSTVFDRIEKFLIYHPNAAADGKEARAGSATNPSVVVDLSRTSSRSFEVEWYQAEDGISQRGDDIVGGKPITLTCPWSEYDCVLRLLIK